MGLNFEQKIALRTGEVIFGHEVLSPNDDVLYLIIRVHGERLKSYFNYIAHDNLVTEYGLKKFGEILYSDSLPLSDEALEELLNEKFGQDK